MMPVACRCPSGFALVTLLFVLLLLTSVGLYIQLELANQASLTKSVESQLYSLVLAENGVEYARTLLPHVELDELLRGPDGLHSGTGRAEWRSPFSYTQARRLDPLSWIPSTDDGWPSREGELLLPQGYCAAGQGRFYIRFSNNPEEPADDDQDGVVLVRSAGIVRSNIRDLFSSSRNDVTMVEAVFRQERVFDPGAALLLFGDTGEFRLIGTEFEFDGREAPAVSIVTGSSIEADLRNSLSAGQADKLAGGGLKPSLVDRSLEFLTSKTRRAVFSPRFWAHFEEHVSAFTDSRQPGLFYYANGGALESPFEGLLVARGDFDLAGASVTGLVVHLGGGRLTLAEGTSVIGGIWMSNVQPGEEELTHQPLTLEVSGAAHVIYDAGRVREALALLPPTQLGWRILFPEMKL